MIRVFIATSNQKEGQILEMVFKQRTFQVQLSQVSPSNYLEFVQYKPDIIIIELGTQFMDQLSAIKLVRANRRLASTPIICYGSHQKLNTISQFIAIGITKYFLKPLKIGPIFEFVQKTMEKKGLDLSAKLAPKNNGHNSDEISDKFLGNSLSIEEKIKLGIDHVGKLLSFPFSIPKIVDCTEDQSTGAADLAKTISTDSAITATILKISNSIQFHSQNREINDIKDAIVRVGFNEVKNIALGLSVMKIVKGKAKNFGFDRMDYWYHALATGILSEKLAQKANYSNPSFAFLAGLLQDFGALLFDEFFHKVFQEVLSNTTKKGTSVLKTQSDLLGFNHLEFCAKLFENWKLPSGLIDTQAHQKDYQNLSSELSEKSQPIVESVGMANTLAKALAIGRSCDEYIEPLSDTFLIRGNYPAMVNHEFCESVRKDVSLYTHFLNLESRKLPDPDRQRKENSHQILYANLGEDALQPQILFLEELAYQFISIEDPAELSEKLEANEIKTLLLNLGPKTPKADVESWVDAYKMVGTLPGKPEAKVLLLCDEDGIVRKEEGEEFGLSISKSSDLRNLEHLIEPKVQLEDD